MTTVFKAPSRLDGPEVQAMRAQFERLATARDDVVIDLARTEVVDGSGVGAMVFAFKRLSADGKSLTIRNVSGQPLNLLNESGLLRTLSSERPKGVFRAGLEWMRSRRLLAKPAVREVDADMTGGAMTVSAERTKGAA